MSERVLKILLTELASVRIICHGHECGAVVELPLALLEKPGPLHCPLCRAILKSPVNAEDHLAKLAQAVRDLSAVKGVEVQFVLPAKE